MKYENKILNSIAPCSMFCTTCTACEYGEISKHSKKLLKLLEGHEEFLEKNLRKQYIHKLEEFKIFSKKLKKYAYPKCDGCRKGGANGCSIKDCFIPECAKKLMCIFVQIVKIFLVIKLIKIHLKNRLFKSG